MQVKHFDDFFSESPIPMWVYDPRDYSIRDVNRSMVDLYGYSRDEMLSFTLFDLRPQEEIPKLKKHLANADTERFSEEGIWKHKKSKGELIYVHVITYPVWYDGDDHTYQLAMYKDITKELNYQQRFEMLFDYSLDGIMLTNPNGDILQANRAACEMLGMSEREIIQRGREGIVAKDDKLQRALEQRSETGKFTGELNYIHKKGHKIPVELTTSVFTNYAGEKRTSLIFRDISDRKKQEEALRQEKEFTEAVLKSLPGVFYILNQEGRIVQFNEHSTEVFGLTADEIKGKPAVEFVHETDKQKVPVQIRKVLEEGYQKFELTLNVAGGEQAVYQFNAEQLRQDGETYIIGTGINITKQKDLEQQLGSLLEKEHVQRIQAEVARDKIRDMFEKAPSPKCVLEGPELRYSIVNKAYCELVGQNDIEGKKLTDVIPEIEEQGYVKILKRVYETGEPYIGKKDRITINKEQDGVKTEYILNILYEPLFDENGEVYGIFAEGIDISDQLSYQRQLEKSLNEKVTLLQEIHHRVKNNLAIVSSMMELQAMETGDTLLENSLRTAQQRIQTIATIHELLYGAENLSHLNFGENVRQLVQNIEEVYNEDNHISVTVQAEPISLNINQAIP